MTAFLLQAVLISLSGVMAPGPLSAAIVGQGRRSPHAGALVALGHGIVEFPLMAVILIGFTAWLDAPSGFDLRRVLDTYSAMGSPEGWVTSPSFLDKLAGTDAFRKLLGAPSAAVDAQFAEWTEQLRAFEDVWRAHLAYPIQR